MAVLPGPLRGIPSVRGDTPVAVLVAALDETGCALVEQAVEPAIAERVARELAPHRAANAANPNDDWSGARTVRTGAVLHRSPAARALSIHPLVLSAAAQILRRNCLNIHLNNCLLMEVLPGEKPQVMHRDELAWAPLAFPTGMEVVINAMWAITDFTPDNGSTIVFPGSHRWSDAQTPDPEHGVKAVMKKGSVFLFTGKCIHGAGGNSSRSARLGLSVAYLNGLLRQSENQYLTYPPEVARELPEQLIRLLGYSRGGDAIGHYRDIEHPMAAVFPERAADFPRGYRFSKTLDEV